MNCPCCGASTEVSPVSCICCTDLCVVCKKCWIHCGDYRHAKANGIGVEKCNPADHPGDCACENCDEEAHRQAWEDAIERTELIGGLER